MSEAPHAPSPDPGDVQGKAEAIVAAGDDVRAQIARLVAETAGAFQSSGEGLIALTRSILAGAGDALEKGTASLPADGPLRQVIDGLGDGLSNVALSARLALDEARARNQQFASADVSQIRKDFAEVSQLYLDTISNALGKIGGQARGGVADLASHAETVKERVVPAVQSALDAVKNNPMEVGKESLQAGLAVGREATGNLFTAIGKFLQDAGQKLSTPPTSEPPPPPSTSKPPADPPLL